MRLLFLGTRGYIDSRTPWHQQHSSLLLTAFRRRLLLDAGEDWLGRLDTFHPTEIFVTHAHPDHAFGLRDGAPCPVYATQPAWDYLAGFRVQDKRLVRPREPVILGKIRVEAFPAEHSTLAPAVGYRITAGAAAVFYMPDVVFIYERHDALAGVQLYIGDGASLTRSLVRKPRTALVGHSSIRTQIGWCMKEGVPRAVFTHCGTEIVTGDPGQIQATLQRLARERGVRAEIAYDGLELTV